MEIQRIQIAVMVYLIMMPLSYFLITNTTDYKSLPEDILKEKKRALVISGTKITLAMLAVQVVGSIIVGIMK